MIQFTDTQLEYGDTNLIDAALRAAGWSWNSSYVLDKSGRLVEWLSPRTGQAPEAGQVQTLKHATKAISHSDYFYGWFRPDIFGHHYLLLTPDLPVAHFEDGGAGSVNMELNGIHYSAIRRAGNLDVPRLLHFHALRERMGQV